MIKLDRRRLDPMFRQLEERIRSQIASGELKPGDPLPDERALARQLKVSRVTVRRALCRIAGDGLVERVRGRGTFVRGAPAAAGGRPGGVTVVAPFSQADLPRSLFYFRIVRAILQELAQEGQALTFQAITSPPAELARALGGSAGGVVVLGVLDQKVLRAMAALPVPVVLVDSAQPAGRAPLDSVVHRGEESCFQATSLLLEMGHRRVGLLNYRPMTPSARERQDGYERAMAARGIAPDPALIVPVECTEAAAYAAGLRILSGGTHPTAFLCTTDELAVGLMAAARDAGRSVPGQLSVVGFGDLGHFTSPALSSIRIPLESMGARAVELLRRRARQPGAPAEVAAFPTELIRRASCGCPGSVGAGRAPAR